MTRISLLGAVALLAVTSSSLAAADDGPGPFGVTAEAPASAATARVGAVFRGGLGGGHFCTGSVVRSAGHDLVVTAAHCLDGGTDLVFVPGYRDGEAPYGVWRIGRTYVPGGWDGGDRDEDSDIAFARVEREGGKGVQDLVGGNAFAAHRATGATAVTVTGYPSSSRAPVTCTNKPTAHNATQQRIACPGFPSGTSGSPWVNGDGQVVGVLGGHEEGGATDDVSYSVVLGDEAARLYRAAQGE
ncbi:trypsin-like serine peptidase [Streptomyces spongiae]|uniref:Trypsin-like peptidase domain-containing protein n=1 Tax=Streptomyces spongiae TaxID=565072 RepID=A0A5N8Y135_9ACTN|nr:serine protease [Streptomyces spongiae]MPY64685.1 trypsin-like peptidase domain-containing protein [Streptomyces spongiae]